MPDITTPLLAGKLNTLITQWTNRELELQAWQSGTATGGPYLDGRYPITDYLGAVTYYYSPAALQAGVTGPVADSEGFAVAADASATAAAAAQAAAVAARDLALTYQTGAQAAQALAESAKVYAQAADANAQTAKTAAAASATAADASATTALSHAGDADTARAAAVVAQGLAEGYALAADASADAAAASAIAAALFDPSSYYTKVASDALYLPLSGGTVSGVLHLNAPSNTGIPALGYDNASTGFALRYAADPLYGLLMGVIGTGDAWIQVQRTDVTATPYNLQLQPNGGGVLIGGNGVFHAGNVADANATVFNNAGGAHGDVTDFNAVTHFGPKFIQGYTNGPTTGGQFYSMSMGLGSNYAYGTYGVQIAWPRYDAGADSRPAYRTMLAGSWQAWKILAMSNADSGFSVDQSFGGNINIGGSFYRTYGAEFSFFSQGTDTVYATFRGGATPVMRGYVYGDGDGFGLLGNNGAWRIRIPHGAAEVRISGDLYTDSGSLTAAYNITAGSGYGVYVNAAQSVYIADHGGQTYGSMVMGGTKNGWCGIKFIHSYQANTLMVSGADNSFGLYSESAGAWKSYYNGTQWLVQGTKAVPYCDWGGGGKMTASTGAPSGGSNGDMHFQYT